MPMAHWPLPWRRGVRCNAAPQIDAETEAIMDAFSNKKTSQELRMLSSVTLDCQVTKIVVYSGFQL